MKDLKPALLEALAHLPACTAISFAQQEMELPIVVIGDETSRSYARAEGHDYLEEYIFQADVYAASPEERETLSSAVDAAFGSMGLKRLGAQDGYDHTAYAYRKHMRYRALLQGDWIYQ